MKAPKPANEDARLRALYAYEILDTLPEAAYDDITYLATQLCETPISWISLIDRDRQWFKSVRGVDMEETPRDSAFCSYAILTPDTLMVVPDLRADPRFADNPLVTRPDGFRFYAGAPLVTEDGLALGALCVVDREPRQMSEHGQRMLAALARQIMAQLTLRLRNRELHESLIEQERTAHTLRLSEARFSRIIETISDGIIAVDEAQRITLFNRGAKGIFGYDASEVIGKPLHLLIPDQVRALHDQHVTEFGQSAAVSRHMGERSRVTALRSSGEIFPAEASICSIEVNGNRIHAAVLRDITEQVRTEEALRRSEERFRLAWENAPIGVALVGLDRSLITVNRALCRILNDSREELSARSLPDIVAADDLPRVQQLLEQLREGAGPSFEVEVRLLPRESTEVWVSLAAGLLREEPGEAPLHYIVEMVDITARKRLETERDRLLQEEKASRAAVEAANRGAEFLVEVGRALAAASLETETILATAAEHAARFLADLCVIELLDGAGEVQRVFGPLDDPRVTQLAAALRNLTPELRSGNLPGGAWLLSDPAALPEQIGRSPDDAQRLSEMHFGSAIVVPIRVHEQILGAMLLLQDHAEQVADERRLVIAEVFALRVGLSIRKAQLYHEAKSALAARDKILDIVAHDLRNPVGAISLAAEMLAENPEDATMCAAATEMIGDATRRVERLIKNLIDNRSIERGDLALDRSAQDITALLHDLDEATTPLARRSSLALRFQVSERLPHVDIDRDAIWQVLTNILDNALKFAPPDSEVLLRAGLVDDMVRISVSDAGPGIPPEHMESIFLPYWRAYQRARQRGTGLGLAIARALVEAHGGRIWVASEVGVGSTFHVTLPPVADLHP